MDYESYRQSILKRYRDLKNRYVLQDAEESTSASCAQEILFADRTLSTWLPRSTKTEPEKKQDPSTQKIKKEKQKVDKYKVLDGVRKFASQHVLIVGKPGVGKTITLEKLLVEEVQKGEYLTILIELRQVNTSVLHVAYEFTKKHRLGMSLEVLRQKLCQGQCLFLIDGLNELSSRDAQTNFLNFLQLCNRCGVIATTRDIELGGDFGIQTKLELQPLTHQQIEVFVRSYLMNEEHAESLLNQLQSRFTGFQDIPLLLSMLCKVFEEEQQIPKNLGLVFRKCAQRYDRDFKQDVKGIEYCHYLLSYLAFKMIQGHERLNPLLAVKKSQTVNWLIELSQAEDPHAWAEEWLEFLLKHHLFQRKSDDQIQFSHQLWQEYYAAEYLVEYLPKIKAEQIKCNFLNLLKWTESLKLSQLLTNDRSQALRISRLGLETDFLLGAVLADAVQDGFALQSIEQLEKYPFPIRWQYVGKLPWMLSQVRHRLQLLLLSRMSSNQVVFYLSRFLISPSPDVRQHAVKIMAQLGQEEAVKPLIDALKDSNGYVRQYAAKALGKLGEEEAVIPLINALGYHGGLRQRTVKALGRVGQAQTANPLLSALNYQNVCARGAAAEALGQLGRKEAIEPLKAALKDSDSYVRTVASFALR